MKIKIIENILKFIKHKKNTNKKNNLKQNNLKYVRNDYGFFSLENKQK